MILSVRERICSGLHDRFSCWRVGFHSGELDRPSHQPTRLTQLHSTVMPVPSLRMSIGHSVYPRFSALSLSEYKKGCSHHEFPFPLPAHGDLGVIYAMGSGSYTDRRGSMSQKAEIYSYGGPVDKLSRRNYVVGITLGESL